MFKKILLPTDGSEASDRAGEFAISSADPNGSDIIVLNVIDVDYLKSLPQRDLIKKIDDHLWEEGKKALEKFKNKIKDEKCAGNCENIKLITMIKEGKPEDVILKTASDEGVDHIIMGKSGKDSLEKFLVGSTTERVVRDSKVPVSVVS